MNDFRDPFRDDEPPKPPAETFQDTKDRIREDLEIALLRKQMAPVTTEHLMRVMAEQLALLQMIAMQQFMSQIRPPSPEQWEVINGKLEADIRKKRSSTRETRFTPSSLREAVPEERLSTFLTSIGVNPFSIYVGCDYTPHGIRPSHVCIFGMSAESGELHELFLERAESDGREIYRFSQIQIEEPTNSSRRNLYPTPDPERYREILDSLLPAVTEQAK